MKIKKLCRNLLAAGMLVIYTSSVFGATITDVATSHWAYSSIQDVESRGVMSLNSKGQFFPNNTMSYFEVADVLAKATGYVDVGVTSNVDETFKKQIQSNYEAQKATLQAYQTKYSTWDSLYNQQIAYLLGRGYLNKSELDNFITTTNGKESKTVMTKQELAVFIVRLLQKEETAKSTYKSTGYADETQIDEDKRPHVAYLKSIGLIAGSGNFEPNTQITRALCAKLFSGALAYKDTQSAAATTSTSTNTTAAATNNTFSATVKKILTKNANGEYYVLLDKSTSSSWYIVKDGLKVTDLAGGTMSIASVPLESTVQVTVKDENGTAYVQTMQIKAASSTTSSEATSSTTTTDTTTSTMQTITATITDVNAGIIRLTQADGTIKAYVLDSNCVILANGVTCTVEDLQVGSMVLATVQNSSALKIQVVSTGTSNTASAVTNGEVTARQASVSGYTISIKNGSTTNKVDVPSTASIVRNGKAIEADGIRIGDTIQVTKTGGVVTSVTATGTSTTVEGTVTGILLSQNPEITIRVGTETVTYAVGNTSDVYDYNKKDYIGFRDIHLGQNVQIILDSKEVKVIDVKKDENSSVSCKATIQNISSNTSYMDVIIDYDPLSGGTRIAKRVQLSDDIDVTLNGKTKKLSTLEEDMNIIIVYKYLDDSVPEKIIIIE